MTAIGRSRSGLEAALGGLHGRYLRNFRVIERGTRIDVEGEAPDYYRKQLVIRDVRALGAFPEARVRLTVGDPTANCRTAGGPKRADRHPNLLIAAADPELLARCKAHCSRVGYRVQTAATGLACMELLLARRPEIMVLIDQLPWGGSNGILQIACEEGYLEQMAAAYIGGRDGLNGLSDAVIGRLFRVVLCPEDTEREVCQLASQLAV